MSRSLSSDSSLDTFRKEAKRWLKALRAGDAQARTRWVAALGSAEPKEMNLRDVQHALAREYGFAGWSALRQALEDLALARRSNAERVEIVLGSARWGGDRAAATRVLARWPELRSENLVVAAITGQLAEVERRLTRNPAAASKKTGPLDQEPLLYLAYARLPGGDEHALEIVSALLDRGADPNASTSDEWDNPFTVLTGLIGNGEINEPEHPRAKELATLLIERGANPFDTQALYNTGVVAQDDVTWLEFLWAASERRGVLDRWREIPTGKRIGGSVPVNALNFLLGMAVHNHPRRAEWLLEHGADPNTPHAYARHPVHAVALSQGNHEIAELLVKYGARAAPPGPHGAFVAAVMRLDETAARAQLAENPRLLDHAHLLLGAAHQGRADIVEFLLKLGMPVDLADPSQKRALHAAVEGGHLDIVKLLVARGADVDRPTTRYSGPFGWAAYFNRKDIAAFLAPLSRDVINLVRMAMRDRLDELFAAEPALVNAPELRSGVRPLFALPDDEEAAADMAAFLLARGADARVRNAEGHTPEQAARRRGLVDAADLLQVG